MKDCVSCVHEYLSPMSDTCRECGIAMLNYKEAKPKPITNYDRIRAMSVEEMAEFFTQGYYDGQKFYCPVQPVIGEGECAMRSDCRQCLLDWLREEADDAETLS